MKSFGIDLGTTNCALAYASVSEDEESTEFGTFDLPQLVGSGQLEPRPTLPSFIYLPSSHELSGLDLALPWDEVNLTAVGTLGRQEGSKKPDRLISSAKSWLSQEGVERRKAILPWKGAEDVKKMSPVEASTEYLRHIVRAWQFQNPDEPLGEAEVVLTVPASFDAVARDLTAEAARTAGLSKLTLLEEPQAAFYAWLANTGDDWREQVSKGDLVLVCDVGGGTTDLTLIEVREEEGELELERVAVGNHILLGGDNMDLTLAFTVSQRLKKEGTKLDSWQFQVLTYGCREAKEKLLGSTEVDQHNITIPGRGSSLIAGSVQVTVTREEAEQVLLNGFFPEVELGSVPTGKRKVGLTEIGLPYESDPAITRHLSGFLGDRKPTAILFNGGVFQSEGIRKRLLDITEVWFEEPLRVLQGTHLDLAVARGAARYGLVKRGHGIRIRGGLSRAYYIGVELAMPAIPGMEPPLKAVCVAPQGMEEGTSLSVPDQEFGLVVGEPVEFPFLAATEKSEDEVGATHEDWEEVGIESLAAVGASLEFDEESDLAEGRSVPVRLETVATEIGTLELYCVEKDGPGRWKLEFNVRTEDE
ncbi:MAG: Hsp70 family protein [Vulcanimicrobiota bacterium]